MTEKTISFINNLNEATKQINSTSVPQWFSDLRGKSLSRFNELGVPSSKDEEWKYTSVSPILENTYSLGTKNNTIKEDQAYKEYCADDKISLVFVNGLLSKELSKTADLPKGLTLLALNEALVKEKNIETLLKRYETNKTNSFTALNSALTDNGTYIKVDDNAVIEQHIHIIHVTSSSNGEVLSLPRSIIYLGKSSEATVLESHVAFDDSITYFSNALTDIYLSENSTLHHCKAQKESLKAFHIGNTRVWQEANSNLNRISIQTGGRITRNNLDIILNGEGINSTLDGLYCIYGNQHVDNHTSVDHRFPNCTSNQLYKGILNGASRAVFNGKIFVRDLAQKTNSYQLNKNLLLGKDCRVDTKPQLEIFADDVKCTHGATVGQLDQDELFYLQTRCIEKNAAVKMLAIGFVEDLLSTIKDKSIDKKLHILLKPSFNQFQ